jgi:CubicO group peptidase (beta-lactamase class C family)
MSRRPLAIVLALIVGFPVLLLTLILGMWAYANATAPPLHPDPRTVRSVTRRDPSPKWIGAVARGREITRSAVASQNVPGISVAVGADGEIVWAEGFGWANVDNPTPVTPRTKFRAADASRSLTSAAVGLLLEQNALHLEDEIQLHVSEFPKKPWPVTLRQLMAQVAGVPDYRGEEPLTADVVDDEARLVARCERTVDGLKLDDFAQRELQFEPGTEYRPSSYGWILVSAAVEAAAKEPFFSFVRTRVFEPLDMRDTTVDVWTETIPDRTAFYFPRFDVIADITASLATREPPRTRFGPKPARKGDYSCYAGAAAFLSTPSDLVRFGMATSRGLRQGFGAQGRTLLKPETIDELQTPQRLSSGKETGYGLGWELETVSLAGRPTRMAGHGAREGFTGAGTSLITFPEHGLVVAVMANISYADTKSIALQIAEAFAEHGKSRARK